MNTKRVGFLSSAASAVCLAFCAPAMAAPTFTGPGDFGQSWTIDDTSTNNNTPVSGVVYWDLFEDNGHVYFGFSIVNTTGLAGTRITGFAWDFPAGTGAATPTETGSSLGWLFDFNSPNLPGEPLDFDVCTYPQANCQAGGNSGIEVGDAFNWFYVKFDGPMDVTAFADSRACLRFVSIPVGAGSDVACRGDEPTFDVPEPTTLGLLGLGLLGFGLARTGRKPVAAG